MGSLNFSGISESPTTSEGPSSRDQVVLTPIILEGLVDSNYIVGSGDFFELIVESSNLSVQVSPEGNVALEQAGVVNVGGVTLAEAKRRILSLLSKRYLASECYIKLAQLKKFRVGVYGSVYSSGQQVVDGGTRVSALLRQAGGLTTFGNLDSVLLLRKGDTLVLHMEQIDLTGDIHQDPLLQQGDFVFVPKLNLTGDVIYIRMESMTRAFPWKKGKTLMTYLQQSNLLKGAPNQFTHLQLINSKTQEITMVPMEQAYQLVPEPGMVLVPFWLTYDVFVGGATMTMGRVNYDPSYHPRDYISQAGLSPVSAVQGRLHVIHRDGTDDWIDPDQGKILPGDYIDVRKTTYEDFKDVALFVAALVGTVAAVITAYAALDDD